MERGTTRRSRRRIGGVGWWGVELGGGTSAARASGAAGASDATWWAGGALRGRGRRSGPWAALRGQRDRLRDGVALLGGAARCDVAGAARLGGAAGAALQGRRVGRRGGARCGEARGGASDGEQRASGGALREKREERRNRTEKEPTVFKNLIFGGQGSGRRK
jgi:hypothetical protein